MEISDTIHILGDTLGDVLLEQESREFFDLEERVRAFAKARRSEDPQTAREGAQSLEELVETMDEQTAGVIARAFALYFDLVNTAEDNFRIRVIREEALQKSPGPVHDSIEEAVQLLRESGLTRQDMADLLNRLQIELVLTAHPTEARRRTILSKIDRIAEAMQAINTRQLLPHEEEYYRQILHSEITILWLTDLSRTAQPTPTDEVRTALFFVGQIFWQALPRVYDTLQSALDRYYPGLVVTRPWLRLASWMGGDRDGNPNVTVDVTAETLHLHRGLALEHHRASLQDLSRRLSMSAGQVPLPGSLRAWLDSRPALSEHTATIQRRYPDEPYRLILSLLASDVGEASQDNMKARLLSTEPHAAKIRLGDLTGPLGAISTAIPPAAAYGPLNTTLRQLDIFGLFGARLDVRQESSRINASLGEVLRGLGIHPSFEELEPAQREELIIRLLGEPVPELSQSPGVTTPASETWSLFRLIHRTRSVYGPELLGPFIISMASTPADVLAVLLMAYWSGCDAGLQIVPLFETIQDLEIAPQVMKDLFSLPVYQHHLKTCPDGQIIMIGYSDSNKDGGFLMSNWALYQAQENVARVCREHDVKLTLFHGRGGTTARGGGPTNLTILAQPGGTVNGRYRLTEQGEIISTRYATIDMALRNLEQIVNAVMLASANVCLAPDPHITDGCAQRVSPEDLPKEWAQAMQEMADAARRKYRKLVFETDGFITYWQTATPINEIKRMRIGSRPSSRRPGVEQITKIRAIPWVFSWMQSRYNLPGWYGLGTGIAKLIEGQENAEDLLRDMYQNWQFFRILIENAELSLSKADMHVAAMYDALVPDRELAKQIFDDILAEYQRTVDLLLHIKGQREIMETAPVIQRSIRLRNPYVDPLNYIQVEMLRRLRARDDGEDEDAERIREVISLTINGIAAGLRNTG